MTVRKFLLTLFSASLLSLPAWGQEVWDAGSFEASPGDTDSIAAGAGKIRDTRAEARERADVEHIWGDKGDIADDNGLHRMGSGRCFMQDAEPTALADSIADYDNTGGGGVTDLNDGSTNSSGTNAVDDVGAGRCWIDTNDNNKLYVYIGVAADNTGSWVEVEANRVKAGGGRNLLQNGDFDWDGCTGTSDPTGWTSIADETVTYANTNGLQGDGCQAVVTAVSNADGYTQELANLKAATTYRVTAQVLETGADECILSTSGAATDTGDLTSVDNTEFVQLDGFFITHATLLDTVTISIANTLALDECTWDHIAVYRQENTEVPEAGIVAVYDTYVTVDTDDVTNDSYGDVPDLSITFVPPTEGWILDIKANISIGCEGDCSLDDGDSVTCRIEKDGNEITGTARIFISVDTDDDISTNIAMDTIEINPAAGTSITYTVACQERGAFGPTILYNFQTDEADDPASSLSMIAFPPH